MRFMMLMIPAGYQSAAPDAMPSAEAVQAMMKYNEELKKAGVLLALDGLHPPSAGARVSFKSGKPLVTDGPFVESKEQMAGYVVVDCATPERAEEIAGRFPDARFAVVEVRPLMGGSTEDL